MKNHYYMSLIAAVLLGLAGSAYAQDGTFNAEEGNGKWSAVEPAATPEYKGYRYFNAEIGDLPQPETVPVAAPHRHGQRPGKLELATPTRVGAVTLKPGEYVVRHVDEGKQHFVEFSQMVENRYPPEGMSPYQLELAARVNCTRKPLSATVAQTELLPASNGMTARLEIRGEKAAHLF